MTLRDELTDLLNKHSAETASGTPDFVLADFLLGCLAAWDESVPRRDAWRGREKPPDETADRIGPVVVAEDETNEQLEANRAVGVDAEAVAVEVAEKIGEPTTVADLAADATRKLSRPPGRPPPS